MVTLSDAAYAQVAPTVGAFVQRSAHPGDTATVLFGKADVQQATGLRSPYEHLWTLPMRTLDPHLANLQAVLRGPAAPTWVVAWGDLDPWNIDAHGRTRLALATHYRPVARVCGQGRLPARRGAPHPRTRGLPLTRAPVTVTGPPVMVSRGCDRPFHPKARAEVISGPGRGDLRPGSR